MRNYLRGKWLKLKQSRFFLGLICVVLGICGTIIWYEGNALAIEYREAMIYWEDYQVRKSIGGVVQAAPFVESETEERESRVTAPSVEEIADKVFILESSGGKNDWCVDNNAGFNGYGYAQNKNVWLCYDTQEEVRALVIKWFEEKQKNGLTLNQALCLYNTGSKSEQCDYSVKFLAV